MRRTVDVPNFKRCRFHYHQESSDLDIGARFFFYFSSCSLAKSFAFLVTTAPGGAADAGIRSGDGITSIDGVLIRDFQDLVFAIDLSDVGDVVPVEVNRDGEVMTFDATLQPWTPQQ